MEAVLAAEGVGFSYGAEPALEDVDFILRRREFVALVGPNGSGKSTLLRVLLGLLTPSVGTVRLLGEPPERLTERWRIGYVPQRPALARDLPATVEEIVSAGRLARRGWWRRLSRADREAAEHAMASVALLELRARRVSELSGGQQQRAFIAKALVSEPNVLVLDEPVAGVDAESQRLFRDSLTHMIEDHDAAVLLASHELGAVASDLTRVVVLKRKVLFDGTPDALVKTGVSLGVHAEDLPLWLEELR
ncbi:MAG: metal ABC transporter ATP-binding protein [Actinomycetota bacterium]